MARSWTFILLTFGFSWALILGFYLAGGEWGTLASTFVALGMMFIPALVAIYLQKVKDKQPLRDIGLRWSFNRWWWVAWLAPVVLALVVLGVQLFFPGVAFDPSLEGFYQRLEGMLNPEQVELMRAQAQRLPINPFWLALLQAIFAGATINAIAGMGEELGWRGYLQREWEHLGFWKMSLLIGLAWGVWHAPVILQGHNYPEHPVAGVFMMIGWCVLLAPLFSFIRIKGSSVIPAAIMHGALNAAAGLPLIPIKGGSDLLVGVTGLAGFAVLLVLNLFLLGSRYRVIEQSP